MKAIIFDLDNTLIDWIDEYNDTIKLALEDCGIDSNLVDKVNEAIDLFDKNGKVFNKKELLSYINQMCNLNLPIKFMDKIEEYQGECAKYDENLINVIKYLNSKYDLYLVSNWFTKTQENRLKKAGIYQYFKGIYGADNNYLKPNPKAFEKVLKNYQPENIISIGDSYINDIEPSLKLGMNVLLKTDEKKDDIKTFNNLDELMNIL